MAYIECHNLSKAYRTKNGKVSALQNVSLGIEEREFICILGPSGCGKTTLLKILAGLEQPDTGSILLDKWGTLVFQEYGLFPWMTILENAAFGLEMQGVNKPTRYALARKWLIKQGLGAFENHYPHQLSGGMRQRVAIVRALLSENQLLLMDEPFGALDAQTRYVLQKELIDLWQQELKTIIYVTHDIDEAILLADRILVMSQRPSRVLKEIKISQPRPRDFFSIKNEQTQSIKKEIWQMLENEVHQHLKM